MTAGAGCVFCKIVSGRLPAAKVLETDLSVALLDVHPLSPGHLLLIPKEHFVTLCDVPPSVLGQVASELPRLSRALLQVTEAPALTVTCNNGKEAGQEIAHLHFHLIPRRDSDRLQQHPPREVTQDDAHREALRAQIAAALES